MIGRDALAAQAVGCAGARLLPGKWGLARDPLGELVVERRTGLAVRAAGTGTAAAARFPGAWVGAAPVAAVPVERREGGA